MMRVVLVALILLVATSVPVRAQSPAQPQSETQGAEKAQGQEISIEALQGVTISGVVNYAGRFRTHLGESASTIAWSFRLKIGPGATVAMSHKRNVSWQGKDGAQDRLNQQVGNGHDWPSKANWRRRRVVVA